MSTVAFDAKRHHIAGRTKGDRAVTVEQTYLKAILATVERQAFPPDQLGEMVKSNVGGDKQLAAYNLCDGEHTQAEIASSVGLDKGNLSRSISRWIELGILIRVGDGSEAKPTHLYQPPTDQFSKKKAKKKNAK
jgi:hypothetical protein